MLGRELSAGQGPWAQQDRSQQFLMATFHKGGSLLSDAHKAIFLGIIIKSFNSEGSSPTLNCYAYSLRETQIQVTVPL